jgi:hypothetical protein
LVAERICALLEDQPSVYEAIGGDQLHAEDVSALLFAAKRLVEPLRDSVAHARRELFLQLIERVDVGQGTVSILLKAGALQKQLAAPADTPTCKPVILTTPAQLIRSGREVRLAVPGKGAEGTPERDPALIKLVVKAHAAREALLAGQGASIREVAAQLGYEAEYFAGLVKLGYLAPDITAAILDGRQPAGLTRQVLARVRALPMEWGEQGRLLRAEHR